MERQTADLGEVTLSYLADGDPAATPVVLLHGLTSQAATWAGVMPALAGRYRVYAPDQRGHGESGRPANASFEVLRDDVLRFADALGLGRFIVVGHSMGATVGWLLAERYSNRLLGLVAEEALPPDGSGDWPAPKRPAEEPPYDWDTYAAIVRQLGEPDPAWWDEMERISVPLLLVSGGPAGRIPPHLLTAAAGRVRDFRLVTVDAGHRVHADRPGEFLDAVLPFLDGLVTPR